NVLIGCNGVSSVVARWLGFKKPTFIGRSTIRGCTKSIDSHGYSPKSLQFFESGVRFGCCPCDDKALFWYITWVPSSQGKQYIPIWVVEVSSGVLVLLGSIGRSQRHLWDLIMLSPLRYRHPWDLIWGNINKGNVCVLGDSFHPMTPDIGRGACSALEDGVVLARCLAGALLKKEQSGESTEKVHSESEQYKKIEMGLKNYAKERRWRSIVLISTAYVVGFFQQGDGKLTTFFRDKLLAAFLSSLLLKTFLECSHMHLLCIIFGIFHFNNVN
ncbi:monooxygenase 2, partial [Quercus suber]|uniref:monooxygenase 2 n=1 Tax=Quercus suber TaxID=58331 RepID=UPI0032DE9754